MQDQLILGALTSSLEYLSACGQMQLRGCIKRCREYKIVVGDYYTHKIVQNKLKTSYRDLANARSLGRATSGLGTLPRSFVMEDERCITSKLHLNSGCFRNKSQSVFEICFPFVNKQN